MLIKTLTVIYHNVQLLLSEKSMWNCKYYYSSVNINNQFFTCLHVFLFNVNPQIPFLYEFNDKGTWEVCTCYKPHFNSTVNIHIQSVQVYVVITVYYVTVWEVWLESTVI